MGIEASCTARICFVDDKGDKAKQLFKQIVANDVIYGGTSLSHISFKHAWIDSDILVEGNHDYNLIEIEIDDRNFWLERWGLRAIKDNITQESAINSLEENKDWHAGYKDFCKHYGCILDIDTTSENFHLERFVISPDGEIWLEEENDGQLSPDNDIKWSNADYGKKTLHDLLILHYMSQEHQDCMWDI